MFSDLFLFLLWLFGRNAHIWILFFLNTCSIILRNGVQRLDWYGTTNMNKVCGDGGSDKDNLGTKGWCEEGINVVSCGMLGL